MMPVGPHSCCRLSGEPRTVRTHTEHTALRALTIYIPGVCACAAGNQSTIAHHPTCNSELASYFCIYIYMKFHVSRFWDAAVPAGSERSRFRVRGYLQIPNSARHTLQRFLYSAAAAGGIFPFSASPLGSKFSFRPFSYVPSCIYKLWPISLGNRASNAAQLWCGSARTRGCTKSLRSQIETLVCAILDRLKAHV